MAEIDVAEVLEQAGVSLQGIAGFGDASGAINSAVANGGAVQVTVSTADPAGALQTPTVPLIGPTIGEGAGARALPLLVSADADADQGPSAALARLPLLVDASSTAAAANAAVRPLVDVGAVPAVTVGPDTWTGSDIRPRGRRAQRLDGFGALEIASALGGLR